MALNDSLRAFAKKPTGYKLGVFAGGLGVILLLYWQLYYSGLADELDNLKTTNQRLATQHTQLQTREKKFKELITKNDELKEQLIKNRVSLPTSAELPSFFVHLQKQSASSGVSIVSVARRREIKIGKAYVKVPVAMTISGTFYQILQYFKLLNQTDRIITVESLNIGGAKVRADETVLQASFTASTFRLPGDGEDDLFQGEPEQEEAEAGGNTLKDRAAKKVRAARDLKEDAADEQLGDEALNAGGKDQAAPAGDPGKAGIDRLKGGGGTP